MKKDNSEEIFPVVDEEGRVLRSATRGECHSGSRLLHPVVHLHVFDAEGRLYLQRRPDWKDIQPGKWDTAVGGHMDYGEDVLEALRREAREELGLTGFTPRFLTRYVFDSVRERELVNAYMAIVDPSEVAPSAEELDGGAWWTPAQLADAMGKDILTPNFEQEYTRLFIDREA